MKCLSIDADNISHLHDFIKDMGNSSESFRYYITRNPEEAIQNHIITFILFEETSVGYGHLDKEDDKIWLGICVKEKHREKGYGKKIMQELVTSHFGEIHLSVDKDNEAAINLYEFFSFEKIDSNDKLYFMKRNVTSL